MILVLNRKIYISTTLVVKMQYVAVFIIVFAFIALYMFVLSKKKSKGSCGCGQGHCQTGETCENADEVNNET